MSQWMEKLYGPYGEVLKSSTLVTKACGGYNLLANASEQVVHDASKLVT